MDINARKRLTFSMNSFCASMTLSRKDFDVLVDFFCLSK